jgi:integrase
MAETFHLHDLRHTGNVLAAKTGATTADLLARMGHGSARAALRYQHATREADQAIAAALGDQINQGGQPRRLPGTLPVRLSGL